MDEQGKPEMGIDLTDKRAVVREMYDLAMDLNSSLEKIIAEREIPPVEATKRNLGESWARIKIDPERKIVIKPVKYQGDDWWRNISWEIQKGAGEDDKTVPVVTTEELDREKIKQHRELPRNYRAMGDDEKAWIFKDDKGEPVGWVAFTEQGQGGSLSFIGVIPERESGGYGKAILKWLKGKYESISLNPLAYDTAGRGLDVAIPRLRRFYVRNGFAYSDAGTFHWTKKEPNLEDAKTGDTLQATDWLVADGTRYSNNDLMRVYLGGLKRDGKLEEALGKDGAKAAEAWLDLRKQAKIVEKKQEEEEIKSLQQQAAES